MVDSGQGVERKTNEMAEHVSAEQTGRMTVPQALASFQTVLTELEANPTLRGSQRSQKLRDWWRTVEEAGIADEPALQEGRYEIVAWDVRPARPAIGPAREPHWRPVVEWADGTRYPDLDNSPDRAAFFAFLRRRIKETSSPVHRARYADVVWDRDGGYGYALIAARSYLESLPLLKGPEHQLVRLDALLRSLDLGLRLNNRELIASAKRNLLGEFESARAQGYSPVSLDLLRWLLRLKEKRKQLEPTDLELGRNYAQAFAAQYRSADGGRALLAFEALRLAAEFAKRLHDAADEWDLLLEAGTVLEEDAARRGSSSRLLEAGLLQKALAHYERIGASDRTEALKMRIRAAYEASAPEFGVVSTPFVLDFREIDAYADALIAMPAVQSLANLLLRMKHVPSKRAMESLVADYKEQFPLTHLLPGEAISGGRRVAVAETDEERRRESVLRQYQIWSQVNGLMLARLYRKMADAQRWTPDAIVDFLSSGVAFDEDKLPLLRAGIERYVSRDYISSLHVLVPQVEDLLRRLLRKLGRPTVKRDPQTDAELEITLGELLRTRELEEGLGEDLVFYLKYLFVEQTGENLRNDIAHGLLREDRAREPLVTLVLDVLLILRSLAISTATDAMEPSGGEGGRIVRITLEESSKSDEEPSEGAQTTSSSSSTWIGVISDRIVHEFHPERVILFGSHARGDARVDSDIDLLVVFTAIEDPREQIAEIRAALADIPVGVDVIVATPEDIDRRRDSLGDVLYDAIRQGRVLYDGR